MTVSSVVRKGVLVDRRSFMYRLLALGAAGIGQASPGSWASGGFPMLKKSTIVARQHKGRHFSHNFDDDVYLYGDQGKLLGSIVGKLNRLQRYVGFGHFNLMSFDDMLRYSRGSAVFESFTVKELAFLEEIFFQDARAYGFYGERINIDLTEVIERGKVKKIPGTGHYLMKNEALELFMKIKKEVGQSLYLTSGVRSVVKQMALFLRKLQGTGGNLSRASRSLAPPGYSFHGVGDFDVGRKGLGILNFTDAFASTEEYRRLSALGYVDIRYRENNPFGVRYEPWHIKVI